MTPRRLRRGAAAIEFALMMPVVFGAFVSVLELSHYTSRFHAVSRAARDGARAGSITIEGPDGDGSLIVDTAIEQAELVLTSTGHDCADLRCEVDAIWAQDPDVGFYFLTVTVRYPYQPFTGAFPPLSDHIHAEFTMMTQQQ